MKSNFLPPKQLSKQKLLLVCYFVLNKINFYFPILKQKIILSNTSNDRKDQDGNKILHGLTNFYKNEVSRLLNELSKLEKKSRVFFLFWKIQFLSFFMKNITWKVGVIFSSK